MPLAASRTVTTPSSSSSPPSPQVGIEDAVHTALLTLKEGFEGQVSSSNIEVGIIGADRQFRVLTEAEVADYLQEVE